MNAGMGVLERNGFLLAAGAMALAACADDTVPAGDRFFRDAGPSSPEILSFTASSTVVDEGETVFLSWSTASAETVSVEAAPGSVLVDASQRTISGEFSRPLVVPTAFTLLATGGGETVSAMVSVDVRTPDATAPPKIIEFFVSPEMYQGRETSVRVSWTAIGELSLRRNDAAPPDFSPEPFGAFDDVVTESFVEYELSATRAGITVTATRAVSRFPQELEPNDTADLASVPSGSTALGRITAGDRDMWAFEVPALGRVTAFVDNGQTGCPFDSVLNLFRYDPESERPLLPIAQSDDFPGIEPCSRIDPRVDPRASALAEGLYVLALDGADDGDIGQYRLTILVEEAACGNGTVEFGAGEGCDDGNEQSGDGCSATCALEPILNLQTGPAAQAAVPALDANASAVAFVELTADGTIAARYGLDGCAPHDLELLDAARLEGVDYRLLATATADCRIPPRLLTAGPYLVRVRGGDAGRPATELTVRAANLGCGDGRLSVGEACDDGNPDDGDGCSSTCDWELEATLEASPIPGPIDLPETGFLAYALPNLAGQLSVKPQPPDPCTVPTRIAVFDEDGRLLGSVEDREGCATLDPSQHPFVQDLAGPHTLTITSLDGAAEPAYQILFLKARCGDGFIQTETVARPEQCEPPDTAECDADCRLEVTRAYGVDSGLIECTPLGVTHSFSLDPPDEVERIEIRFGFIYGTTPISLNGLDPFTRTQVELRLRNEFGHVLASSVGTANQAPAIEVEPLLGRFGVEGDPRPFYVEVFRENAAAPIPGLEISVPCRAGGVCGGGAAGFVDLGEQCDGTAGCTDQCFFELPTTQEAEDIDGQGPNNDSRASAQLLDLPVGLPARPIVGQLFPPGDVDFYAMELPSGTPSSLRIIVAGEPADPDFCPTSLAELRVAVVDHEGRLIESADESTCARFDGLDRKDLGVRDLPGGRYFLRVDKPNGGSVMSYSLAIQLVPTL